MRIVLVGRNAAVFRPGFEEACGVPVEITGIQGEGRDKVHGLPLQNLVRPAAG